LLKPSRIPEVGNQYGVEINDRSQLVISLFLFFFLGGQRMNTTKGKADSRAGREFIPNQFNQMEKGNHIRLSSLVIVL
jgi:hypothetical protein